MESRFSFICAYANVSTAGNINATEIFADIGAPSFPCIHAKLMYVSSLRFEMSETGTHKFRLSLIDEDGAEVVNPITGNIQVNAPTNITNIILDFSNLSFPKAGTYQFDLSVDGEQLCTDTIRLMQVKMQ